jgi:hypothetical protein
MVPNQKLASQKSSSRISSNRTSSISNLQKSTKSRSRSKNSKTGAPKSMFKMSKLPQKNISANHSQISIGVNKNQSMQSLRYQAGSDLNVEDKNAKDDLEYVEEAMAKVKIEKIKVTPVSQIDFILEKEKDAKDDSSQEDDVTQGPNSRNNSDAQMCDYRVMIEEEQS